MDALLFLKSFVVLCGQMKKINALETLIELHLLYFFSVNQAKSCEIMKVIKRRKNKNKTIVLESLFYLISSTVM